jgi:hypothetical protein
MRISIPTLILVTGLAAPALAQEELAEPEAGDVGTPEGGDMGGDTAAPAEDGAMPADAADASTGGAEKPISVKLMLGYGLSLEGDDPGPDNPWGLGFGVGGGYNLNEIYLGARFIYYLGSSEDVPMAGEFGVNLWELGIEGGYDIDAGGVTIRPGVGLGLANVSVDVPAVMGIALGSASETYFFLAPGVGAFFDVTDSIFLGLDLRLQLVFGDPDMVKGLPILAHGGMRF